MYKLIIKHILLGAIKSQYNICTIKGGVNKNEKI